MENIAGSSTIRDSRLSIPAAAVLGLLLLAVDFTSKALAITNLPLEKRVPTPLGFFSWYLTYNTGSHYLLGSVEKWVPYGLMMGAAGIAVIVLIVLMARELDQIPPSPLRTVHWLLIASLIGALGNAMEVVVLGRATDFFMIRPFPWPGNLCDQFVNVSVFVLLPLSLWWTWKQTKETPSP